MFIFLTLASYFSEKIDVTRSFPLSPAPLLPSSNICCCELCLPSSSLWALDASPPAFPWTLFQQVSFLFPAPSIFPLFPVDHSHQHKTTLIFPIFKINRTLLLAPFSLLTIALFLFSPLQQTPERVVLIHWFQFLPFFL